MREVPKEIRVGANDYKISKVSGLSSEEAVWGRIIYGRTEIELEESLSRSRERDVLAHELAHAILYEAGFHDHEEDLADRVGKVLAMVLRDNDFEFMRDEVAENERN